jgi:hypothetical protein
MVMGDRNERKGAMTSEAQAVRHLCLSDASAEILADELDSMTLEAAAERLAFLNNLHRQTKPTKLTRRDRRVMGAYFGCIR